MSRRVGSITFRDISLARQRSRRRRRLAEIDHLTVPTLMLQGGYDFCDPPATSEGLDGHFDSYCRVVLDGVGHFPHREDPGRVTSLVRDHLGVHQR